MKKESRRHASFPLRIPPTMKMQANELADREGLSLNHFISLAIAEKITRMEDVLWMNGTRTTPASYQEARNGFAAKQ